MTDNDPIDRAALDRLDEWGGEPLLRKMIQLFLENSPERMTKISDGFQASDPESVQRGSHSLKSSAANVGALEVSRIAAAMENATESGGLEQASEFREPLVDAYDRACAALREIEKGAGR